MERRRHPTEPPVSDQRWKHHGIQQRFLSERDREGLRYRGSLEQTLAAFPESYRESLRALHAQYPNWKFEAYQTGIDWQTAVDEESKFGSELSGMGTEARSLVYKGSISSWKSMEEGAFDWSTGQWVTNWDGDYWAIASRELVAYYMDPRNFMDNNGIFQFLDLTYDSTQTGCLCQPGRQPVWVHPGSPEPISMRTEM